MTEPCPIDLFASLRGVAPLDGWTGLFATRVGGTSPAPYDSLNLGFSTDDDDARVRDNRRAFAAASGVGTDAWVVPGQCHGAEVVRAGRDFRGEGALAPSERLRGYDVVVLPETGVFALSLSADCPLALVTDPVTRRGGVAHAGWRGTAAGAVPALLDALVEDGVRPEDCVAAVSPGICGECYEVGDEVLAALAGRPGAADASRGRTVDLRTIHRAELEAAGVPARRIAVCADCTAEDPSRFFSHRRDAGRTGRSGALLGWSEREDR